MKKRKNGQIKGGEGRAHRAVWTRARGRRAASRCGRRRRGGRAAARARCSRSGGAVVEGGACSGGATTAGAGRGGGQGRRDDGGATENLGSTAPAISLLRAKCRSARRRRGGYILQRVIGPEPWHRPGPMTHWSRAMPQPGTDEWH